MCLIALGACGPTRHHKEYYFQIIMPDYFSHNHGTTIPSQMMLTFIDGTFIDLNHAVGKPHFFIAHDELQQYNSTIKILDFHTLEKTRLSSNITVRPGKVVGTGGKIIHYHPRFLGFMTDHIYSMVIQLDAEWTYQQITQGGFENHELLKALIYHEVGHGLGLSHSSNPNSIMYHYISQNKDIASYYKKVRQILLHQ
ncbi:MAG: matrixin family metalloprotease [Proteobacteria bacterium]|nr:matrixin family metalloprotease [Pseudomonadota bacterium]